MVNLDFKKKLKWGGGVSTAAVGRGGIHCCSGEGGGIHCCSGEGGYTLERFGTEKSKISKWPEIGPNGCPEVSGGEFEPNFGFSNFQPPKFDFGGWRASGLVQEIT